MLDELLKGFIVIPADLPRKGVKILATSGERVNQDLWVKMYHLCRVLKTSILAELTVRSGLGEIYIKGDDSCCDIMLIIYCLMLYIIYVTLIMRLWDLLPCCYICGVQHGLTLAISPTLQEML